MTDEFPQEDYRLKRKSGSSQPDQVLTNKDPESFEEVDYVAMRKEQATPGPSPLPTYQPVSTPAWDRHATDGHTKVARFNRLTTWDRRKRLVNAIVFWLVLLLTLGGLSYAYQNKLHMQLIVPQAPSSYQPSNHQPR